MPQIMTQINEQLGDSSTIYSLKDVCELSVAPLFNHALQLFDIREDTYNARIQQLFDDANAHIHSCELCNARAFICEVCDNTADLLFPFQGSRIHQV